jgi:hypothetical protein
MPLIDREPTTAEMAETAGLLERAGLITIVEDDEGRVAYAFTAEGARVDRMRKMANGHEVDEVLGSLLGNRPRARPPSAPPGHNGPDDGST